MSFVNSVFILKNGLQLLVKSGDITRETAGGVVVGEDANFTGLGAVAQALLKAGGEAYKNCRDQLQKDIQKNRLSLPIFSCPAGDSLKYQYVLHAMTSFNGAMPQNWIGLMKALHFDMGRIAEEKKLSDLVTPLLGSGQAHMPLALLVKAAIDGLSLLQPKVLRRVTIMEYDLRKAEIISENVQRLLAINRTSTDPLQYSVHTAHRKAQESPDHRMPNHSSPGQPPKESSRRAGESEDMQCQGPRKKSTRQPTKTGIVEEEETESPKPASQEQRKSQTMRTPLTSDGDTDHDADFRFRGQRKSKAQVLRENAAVSHQRSPSSPDPVLDRSADFAVGNADNDENEGADDSYKGETKRIFQSHTTADKPEESKEVLAQKIRVKILEEGENKFPVPSSQGQPKSESGRDERPDVGNFLQTERPPWTEGDVTDHDADSHLRGQRKSKAQVPREDAAVSHQRSPSSPDPVLDRPVDSAVGNADNAADKGTHDSYQEKTKRIFRPHTPADKSEENEEVLAQKIRVKILEEDENKFPVPSSQDQLKSESSRDARADIADFLQNERSPSTEGDVTDHDSDFRFRGQRKSKAQAPREDAAVSHQSSPPPPDKGLPLASASSVGCDEDASTTGGHNEDTSTTGRDTEYQEETRETALQTQSSEQDPGTEHGNRGQRKGKLGNAGLAAGNTARDLYTVKSSDKETLRSIVGSMPEGTMSHTANPRTHVPGFEGCGVIVVDYVIPDGIQKSEHPQPGSPYRGCMERAFLPDNEEGRRVLKLLKEAFDRRLTFQMCEQPGGQALVEWADIPHKTCLRGPRDRGGYPDPDYLATVQTLLRDKYDIE